MSISPRGDALSPRRYDREHKNDNIVNQGDAAMPDIASGVNAAGHCPRLER
jgi:hypothetical protein